MKRKRTSIVLGCVAALALALVAALAAGGETTPNTIFTDTATVTTPPKEVPEPPPVPDQVSKPVSTEFPVLSRTNAGDPDKLSPAHAHPLRRGGANPDLARLARRGDVGSYWLAPQENGVCLVSDGGAACASIGQVRDAGLVLTNECPPGAQDGEMSEAGVVGRGVDSVTLQSADGAMTVPVVNNVWTATVKRLPAGSRPTVVTWTDQSGKHSAPVGYSPDIDGPC
jgi:hypothetical protein